VGSYQRMFLLAGSEVVLGPLLAPHFFNSNQGISWREAEGVYT